MNGICDGCSKPGWLIPLHGDRGGPKRCFMCAGEWSAKYTRRRKWGRIAIKAMKMFIREGGKLTDLDKLKSKAHPYAEVFAEIFGTDPLPGYEDTIGAEIGDITSELLEEALQLSHPDRHPPERRELANRVTQGLLQIKPFVFPAPKPKPVPAYDPASHSSMVLRTEEKKKPSQTYPCELCADTLPKFYCDRCKAEWTRRIQQAHDKRREKKRKQYAALQERRRQGRQPKFCPCGTKLTSKRKDARFCSGKCRQRAHRNPVTDMSAPADAN